MEPLILTIMIELVSRATSPILLYNTAFMLESTVIGQEVKVEMRSSRYIESTRYGVVDTLR